MTRQDQLKKIIQDPNQSEGRKQLALKELEIDHKPKLSKDMSLCFLDIETAPSLGWVWGKWEQNVMDFEKNGYILSYSIKKMGSSHIKTTGLPDYDMWKEDKTNDSAILADLWNDLDQADVIIAHNGDRFDIPQINTRFVSLGMRPPSPYQTFDTLRVARKKFGFKSNKLDDLCRDLNIGRKLPHTGSHLWLSCMAGDLKAWKTMKRYNRRDVLLLEELYYKFLPWSSGHPPVNMGDPARCVRCGSGNVKYDGFRFTNLRKKEQIHCLDCAGWFEGSAKRIK
jgi:hypothetical protein